MPPVPIPPMNLAMKRYQTLFAKVISREPIRFGIAYTRRLYFRPILSTRQGLRRQPTRSSIEYNDSIQDPSEPQSQLGETGETRPSARLDNCQKRIFYLFLKIVKK